MLYFIERIEGDIVYCSEENEMGCTFPIVLFPTDIETDMAVIRWKNGNFTIYNGAFEDESGSWWQLVYDRDCYHLENRRAPLAKAELRTFIQNLIGTNDPTLLPALDMIVGDLLMGGQVDLANLLMSRAELIDTLDTKQVLQEYLRILSK